MSNTLTHGRLRAEDILVKVYRITTQMLEDRGFTVLGTCTNSADIAERMKARAHLLHGTSETMRDIYVFIDTDSKIGIKYIRTLRETPAYANSQLLLISDEGPTAFTKKEVADPWGKDVQFFMTKELVHNVTKHRLVPPHRRLATEEVEALKSRWAISEPQLPLLLSKDPVRRYYNWQAGDIVEIERRGVTQEVTLYYRLVAIS